MPKPENKTKPTVVPVETFLARVASDEQRRDSQTLIELMQAVVGEEPKMWGPSIVGFGSYHYVYESGREGDTPLAGFSPRQGSLSLYITCCIEQYGELLERLGPHKTGKGCLYVKRLSDIHLPTLKKLVQTAVKQSRLMEREMARLAKKPSKKKSSQ